MKETKNILKKWQTKVITLIKAGENSKKQMCEIKAREQIEDDGVNYEDELKKKVRNRKRNSGKVTNLCATTMLTCNGKVCVLKNDMRHQQRN